MFPPQISNIEGSHDWSREIAELIMKINDDFKGTCKEELKSSNKIDKLKKNIYSRISENRSLVEKILEFDNYLKIKTSE